MGTDLVAVPQLNWGRWVAACPRPFCTNAEQFGRCPDGTVGGLGSDRFECRVAYGGCGLRCGVEWPPNIADIEALVMPRTVPATRNWLPGETVHDLLRENLTHGLVPNDDLELAGDRITQGSVASWSPPQIER